MNVIPNWRPASTLLHYNALYMGVYEFLREYPNLDHEGFIRDYLADLEKYPNSPMQQHRILWTKEWLAHLTPHGASPEMCNDLPDGPF